MERPEIVKDEHLTYLDNLRESGIVNMFGASPFVKDAFKVTSNEAITILSYWMETFGDEDR